MTIDETTDLQGAQASLDCEMARLQSRQNELIAERRRRDEAKHVGLTDLCRAAKATVAKSRAEADALRRAFIQAQGERDSRNCQVASHCAARPLASDYPAKSVTDDWAAELSRRQTAASEAERAYSVAWGAYQVGRKRWFEAREEFDKLVEEEAEIRTKLQPPRGGAITLEIRDGIESTTIRRTA
jgi:hypothetical protein